MKIILCGLTTSEILESIGSSDFSAKQALAISNSIYKKRIKNFYEIDGISKILKDYLRNNANIGIIPPVASQLSEDNSVKYLFRTQEGKEFETVYIPNGKRNTVCVSTQSGCRMGCSICATAGYGFSGNLTTSEIINQIISIPYSDKVTHVVFMGMGEPLDNFDNVLKSCEIITAEWGLSISPRNVTVSTVGLTPGIVRFLNCSFCNLTVSLYSPFSLERERFLPVERQYPVNEIISILKDHKLRKKRRITLAYVMIRGQNDSDHHLDALKSLIGGTEIRVNLLPYNNLPEDHNVSSCSERMLYFKHNLIISGISASVRTSRGADISAACGLLACELKK